MMILNHIVCAAIVSKADPTRSAHGPLSQKFGGNLWANIAHGGNFAGSAGL